MPRAETIARNPPTPCEERPCYKTCKGVCKEVEDWINQGTRGRNSKVLLANETWSDDSTSVPFVDYEAQKHGVDMELMPDLDAEAALELMTSLRMKPHHIDIIERRTFKCERVRDIAMDLGVSSQCVCHRYRSAKFDLVRRLQRRKMWEHVDQFDMPPRHRRAAELYFRDLYRVRDISRIMGSRESDISQILLRVREKISMIILSTDGGLACEASDIMERGLKVERKDAVRRLENSSRKAGRKTNPNKFRSLMESQIMS